MDAGDPRAGLWTAGVPSGRAGQEDVAAAGFEELLDDELLDDEVPDEPDDGVLDVPDVPEEVLDDDEEVSVEVLDDDAVDDDEPERESVR